jgi:hypothetical protein
VGQESTAEKTKSVRLPLQKLKKLKLWNDMKKLTKANRKKIINELAIKILDGEQLVSIIRKFGSDAIYITKWKALKIPLDFITYQGKEEVQALVNSRATDNFIFFFFVFFLIL